MHVSAKGDYAARAVTVLARCFPDRASAQSIAEDFGLPRKFLEMVLADLRRAGVVTATRGADGGYALKRDPSNITLGEVLRAVDGPLAAVHGLRPEEVSYPDGFEHLKEVWIAARSAVRLVFDEVTLDQLLSGRFPDGVQRLFAPKDAWEPRLGPQAPSRPTSAP